MADVYYLTGEDRAWLKALAKRELAESQERLDTDKPKDTEANPEVYLVKLPEDGIPKAEGDIAGLGFCEVLRMCFVDVFASTPEVTEVNITPVTGPPEDDPLRVAVYNPYKRPWFAFSKYILTKRDAYGLLVCQPPPTRYQAALNADLSQGGTSTASIYYRQIDPDATPSPIDEWADSGEDFDVVEFVLNDDEMFVAKQKGAVTWDEGGVWVFDSTGCPVPDDTGLIP